MQILKSKLRQTSKSFVQSAAPKRFFSAPIKPQGGGMLSMALLGAGSAGLAYLMLKGSQLAHQRNASPMLAKQMNYFEPVVQQRIRNSLMYFGTGLAGTGLIVSMMRNSLFALNHPWMLMFGSIGFMLGTLFTNYQQSPVLKHALWGGFLSMTALGMVPLIQMASLPIIYDALFATGITMGGLGLVAYNAPSEQFLKWGGALGMGCAGMIGISLMNMFYPSPALFNIWLYGGLVLFSAFVLYDVQKLIYKAKTRASFDPINESLGIYLDAIMLFERFLIIFMNNKKK